MSDKWQALREAIQEIALNARSSDYEVVSNVWNEYYYQSEPGKVKELLSERDRFEKALKENDERFKRYEKALREICDFDKDWGKGTAYHVNYLQGIAEKALEGK